MMETVWVEHQRKAVLFCRDTDEPGGRPKGKGSEGQRDLVIGNTPNP